MAWAVCDVTPPPPPPPVPFPAPTLPPGLGEAGLVLDARCSIAASELGQWRAAEHCDGRGTGAAAPGGNGSAPEPAWGLPSSGCPRPSRRLLDWYPKHHADLRLDGRVLQFCYLAPLGNYLEALPAAFLLSLLLDLALVVHCDVQAGDHMAQFRTKLPEVLPAYFEGAHFDWLSAGGAFADVLPRNASALSQGPGAFGELARAPAGMRARLNTRALPAAVLAHAANRRRLRAELGAELVEAPNLAGCLLRYLLRPSARLRALQAALAHAPAQAAEGASLLAVALHVRLGDHFLGATRGKDADSRSVAYQRDPLRAMRCLARAARGADGACLQAVVIADSGWVERCASRALAAVALSPGIALHPHKSAGRALERSAIDKLFVDWWLLARARGLLTFVDGSSFSRTAAAFRDAGDPLGWTLRIGVALGPDAAACAQPTRAGAHDVPWTLSRARAGYCAVASRLGCVRGPVCALAGGGPLTGEGALAALLLAAGALLGTALLRLRRRTARGRAEAHDESELAPFLSSTQ